MQLDEYNEWSTKLKNALVKGKGFNVSTWRAYKEGKLKTLPGT